ncbi:MAG: LysE family transporter [Chloroflexi bacterium]|nr:LysE family transporter [Chloroflexota bacterium]MBI3763531.1 LysE family transporter [Chloroflexota bacterium]
MTTAFWQGVLAGYGIAIPVGAIAILIVETGLQRGFGIAFAAGAGAAGADLFYATIAAVAGATLASALTPFAGSVRITSALVLLFLGGRGLYSLWRSSIPDPSIPNPSSSAHFRTFLQFLGLTLLNPLTIAYFAALILGMKAGATATATARAAFVVGAALASLSWQSLLAGVGAVAKRHLSPRFRLGASVFGNLIIAGMGVRILLAL